MTSHLETANGKSRDGVGPAACSKECVPRKAQALRKMGLLRSKLPATVEQSTDSADRTGASPSCWSFSSLVAAPPLAPSSV